MRDGHAVDCVGHRDVELLIHYYPRRDADFCDFCRFTAEHCHFDTNTTTPTTVTSSAAASPAPSTPVGLPPYTPPPPDAAGNPPCEFGVGWDTFYDGDTGLHGTRVVIEKTPLEPNQYVNLPDHVTIAIQTTDERHFTQDAYVGHDATDKWDSVAEKDFNFRTVDPADIKEVLMTTSKGTCWVDGNP